MKTQSQQTAAEIKDLASQLGWTVSKRNSVLSISKNITPGNKEDFCKADSEYGSIFALMPRTSQGSVWGTDGGGIGSMVAMNSGRMVMNMSGCSKRVLNQI